MLIIFASKKKKSRFLFLFRQKWFIFNLHTDLLQESGGATSLALHESFHNVGKFSEQSNGTRELELVANGETL